MKHLFCAALIFTTALPLFADQLIEEILCHKSSSFFVGADSSEFRKYAPSREVDILHLKLDVTPDFKTRTVSGIATLSFKPIAKPLDELRLDGIDLSVSGITSTEKIESYQVTDEKIVIHFAKMRLSSIFTICVNQDSIEQRFHSLASHSMDGDENFLITLPHAHPLWVGRA